MRAAILTRFGAPFEICDDVEIDPPGEHEVLVKVTHCGVCHSDFGVWEGAHPAYPLPAILGHEAAGVISEVGSNVNDRHVGQKVILSFLAPCGTCYQCVRGNFTACEKPPVTPRMGNRVRWRGQPLMRGFGLGAFAEYVLVDARNTIPVDAGSPLDVAAVVGCAVQTGVGAVRNIARVSGGESTLVIGAGSVGICVLQGARLAGASVIAVVDPNGGRREQALAFGATHAFDASGVDVAGEMKRLTGGRGADHAFDLVCTNATIDLALNATRPAAAIILIGVPGASVMAGIQPMSFVMAQKQLKGCMLGNCNTPRDLPLFMDLGSSGELQIDRLITARRPLIEVNAAFADLAAGRGLRTVLQI